MSQVCGDAGAYKSPSIKRAFDPAPEAVAVIERMTRSIGLSTNFKILAAEFRNDSTALAGKRGTDLYIVYDVAKFSMKDREINYRDLGILAHEIGHHAHSHFRSQGPAPNEELDTRINSIIVAF